MSNLSLPDPRARMWLLRHWLLCLLDRSKKFKIGAGLPRVVGPHCRLLSKIRQPGIPLRAARKRKLAACTCACPAGEKLTLVLSQQAEMQSLFAGLEPQQVSLGGYDCAKHAA